MSKVTSVESRTAPVHIRDYLLGFGASLLLTGSAYFVATSDMPAKHEAMFLIGILAVVQCGLQLMYFLHLGREFKPRYRLMAFVFALSMLLIVVFGSLWIMQHLNYNMLYHPAQQEKYLRGQDGL